MPTLPTRTLASTPAEHLDDHMVLKDEHNAPTHAHTGTLGRGFFLPTGALAATMSRKSTMAIQALTSGRQTFTLIELEAGMSISNITFVSDTVAAVTPTNQWFSLASLTGAKLAQTADDTTTAWPATTPKTLAVTGGPYVVPTTGFYYLGIMVAASTMPNLSGVTLRSAISGIAPFVAISDAVNGGLTTPASAPATAVMTNSIITAFYGYVS